MNWATIQQLIRILAYLAGGYFLGEGATSGEQFQQGVSALIAFVAFIWWAYQELKKKPE